MLRFICCLILLLPAIGAYGQDSLSVYTWEDFLEAYTDDEEHTEDEAWEARLEELKQLHDQPLNINTATVDELLQLPFLTEEQIEQIHADIYLNGAIRHLGMLRLLRSIDDDTWRKLLLFVYAGEPAPGNLSFKERLLHGIRHTFSSRTDIPLYYRKGFVVRDGYVGDPLYHRIKYQLSGSRHLAAGLRVEKDPGERYFDTYGAYVMFSALGRADKIVAGDYRAGFGEGVVMGANGNAWGSKSMPPSHQQTGLRPMTSMDETRFLRGIAATFSLGRGWDITLMGSHRRLDATLDEEGRVHTLLQTGLHRTSAERDRQRNVAASLAGAHLGWKHGGWQAGCTGYYQYFSCLLYPGEQLHRRIYPRGRHFGATGIHYAYSAPIIRLAGETAFSPSQGGWASLNRVEWMFHRRWSAHLLQRFYSYRYHSFHSGAFGENSLNQNESGLLLRLKGNPWPRWQWLAYADFFYHPWPRYQLQRSSRGTDLSAQSGWQCTPAHLLEARYQYQRKMYADGYLAHHRIKVRWTAASRRSCRWQTTLLLHRADGQNGWGLQQTVRADLAQWGLRLNASCAAFITDGYNCRLSFYDPPLYASVCTATYFGQGIVPSLSCRWTSADNRWMVEAKYRCCRYFDRQVQSSGLQTIMGPWKQDASIGLVVRW